MPNCFLELQLLCMINFFSPGEKSTLCNAGVTLNIGILMNSIDSTNLCLAVEKISDLFTFRYIYPNTVILQLFCINCL